MLKSKLIFTLLILGILGCSEPERYTLEFRIAEDEPSPGLSEVIHSPTGKRFYLHPELTEVNVGKRCAMILNGELVSAPRIMSEISIGKAILAGDFTEGEACRIDQQLLAQHRGE